MARLLLDAANFRQAVARSLFTLSKPQLATGLFLSDLAIGILGERLRAGRRARGNQPAARWRGSVEPPTLLSPIYRIGCPRCQPTPPAAAQSLGQAPPCSGGRPGVIPARGRSTRVVADGLNCLNGTDSLRIAVTGRFVMLARARS